MAVIETPVLLTSKDKSGNKRLIYPITQADCVDGLEELIDEKVDPISHVSYDWDQNDPTKSFYIENKPFGVLGEVIPTQEVTFTQYDNDFTFSDVKIGFKFVAGNIYRVLWDGVEYVLVAKAAPNSNMTYIGNFSIYYAIFGGSIPEGTDTGEPFVALTDSLSGIRFYALDGTVLTHTISIQEEKLLDRKWLPDGIAMEDYVNERIAEIEIPDAPTSLPEVTAADDGKVLSVKNGVWTATEAPAGEGGSVSTETDILAKQEIDGFIYDENWSSYTPGAVSPAQFVLVSGNTYLVEWDGTVYTCEAYAYEQGGYSVVVIGNGSQIGQPSNGEPFLVVYNTTVDVTEIFSNSDDASHTVRIYQKKVETDTVGWNDFFEKTAAKETEILPETSVTSTSEGTTPSFTVVLVSGATIRVMWDGTEYVLTAKEVTLDGMNGVVVGNASLGGFGGEDTGEPFVVGYVDTYAITMIATSTTEESTHTVQIFQTTPETYTLKEEYLGNVDYETKVINKPFGEIAEAGTIIADHNADYDSTDFGFLLTDIDTFESHINAEAILEGATYSVEIAGITYDGVGMTAEALKQIMPSFDGSPIAGIGIAIYQDGTLWGALASMQNILWFIQPLAPDSYNSGERYQVKITVVEAIKKIDAKYLPMDAIKAYIDEYLGEVLRGNY